MSGRETEWDDYGRKGRDEQKKKMGKANEKIFSFALPKRKREK